jgi:threonine/homoserine/homoserine lactone efflux protein
MVSLGRLVQRGRTALRVVILAAVIIGFIIHKQANWQNVLWCVGISLVLWVVVDILAAAADGRPAGPAVEAEAPVPVDA